MCDLWHTSLTLFVLASAEIVRVTGWAASAGIEEYNNKMKPLLRRLWEENQGQDIAEYALMLAVILLIVAATVSAIGTNANNVFNAVSGKLTGN